MEGYRWTGEGGYSPHSALIISREQGDITMLALQCRC